MPHAHHLEPSNSPVFRLDTPEMLDVHAIESTADKNQRLAWRYLIGLFEQSRLAHCNQFTVEPDATLWRIRFRNIDGFDEHVIPDPRELVQALNMLQKQLWGENYSAHANRSTRFTWPAKPANQVVNLRVIQTVNGDLLQFDTESMRPMPPMLDELDISALALGDLRVRLAQRQGMVLITSSEPTQLDDTLLAINQEMISPDRKLLSISERHRFSLPRTTQVNMTDLSDDQNKETWKNALDSHHDTILINACVPEIFHERIANACDQGTLAIHAMYVTSAADALNLLNADILRRTPLHRSVTTMVNHFAVKSLCQACASKATLTKDEQNWLEQTRTPATENVISWLADGNPEKFMMAEGCNSCNGTGNSEPLSVFDVVHRDKMSNQFPTGPNKSTRDRPKPLQRQLMSLAKAGTISLSEVLRVLALAG